MKNATVKFIVIESYLYIKLFGYLGMLPMAAKTTGPIRMEFLPLIPSDPGMVLGKKIFEKIQKGARGGPFCLKKCVFLEYFDYLSSDWTETLTT